MPGVSLQQFKGHSIRITDDNGEPRFVLSDLCAALGLKQPARVAQRLDEDEKGVTPVHTPGGIQQMLTVNESGLYAVILRSDKPQAREFRKWVTNEVLPTLRKAGTYSVQPAPQPDFSVLERMAGLTAQAIETRVAQAEVKIAADVDAKLGDLSIYGLQIGEIYRRGQKLGEVMGGSRADRARAWRTFNDAFGLASYRDLPARMYEQAVRFLDAQIASYEAPQTLKFGQAVSQ